MTLLTTAGCRFSNLPGQGRVAGTRFSFNGKGYILSGEDESHRAMVTGEIFWNLEAQFQDAWNVLPPHPGYSRWAPASFLLNGEIYIINGVTKRQMVLLIMLQKDLNST
ncbi:MAG: hypothetical protein R2879_21245 [Saprospiraceae bacterium]